MTERELDIISFDQEGGHIWGGGVALKMDLEQAVKIAQRIKRSKAFRQPVVVQRGRLPVNFQKIPCSRCREALKRKNQDNLQG